MWFLKNKTAFTAIPDYWIDYQAKFKKGKHQLPLQQPIRETRFVVLDTEATGMNPKKDKMLSIAAVSLKNRAIVLEDNFEYFIRQSVQITADNVAIHGILNPNIASGADEKEAIEAFVKYLGDAIIVGHFIGFDIALINSILKRQFGGKLYNKSIDTARLAIRFEQFRSTYQTIFSKYTLDNLCERYQIRLTDRHTAAGDTYITALLFLKLIARLEERGVKTLGDLFVR